MKLRVRAHLLPVFLIISVVMTFVSSSPFAHAGCSPSEIGNFFSRQWNKILGIEIRNEVRARKLLNTNVDEIAPSESKWKEKIEAGVFPSASDIRNMKNGELLGYYSALTQDPDFGATQFRDFLLNSDPKHASAVLKNIRQTFSSRKFFGIEYNRGGSHSTQVQDLLIEADVYLKLPPEVISDPKLKDYFFREFKRRWWPAFKTYNQLRDQNIEAVFIQERLIPKLIQAGVISKSNPLQKGLHYTLKTSLTALNFADDYFRGFLGMKRPANTVLPKLSAYRKNLGEILDLVEQGKDVEARALYDSKFKPELLKIVKLQQVPLEALDLSWSHVKTALLYTRNILVPLTLIAIPFVWDDMVHGLEDLAEQMRIGRTHPIKDTEKYISKNWNDLYVAFRNRYHYPPNERPLPFDELPPGYFEDFVATAESLKMLNEETPEPTRTQRAKELYQEFLLSYHLLEVFQASGGNGPNPEVDIDVIHYLNEMKTVDPEKQSFYEDLLDHLGKDAEKTKEAQRLLGSAIQAHLIPKLIKNKK